MIEKCIRRKRKKFFGGKTAFQTRSIIRQVNGRKQLIHHDNNLDRSKMTQENSIIRCPSGDSKMNYTDLSSMKRSKPYKFGRN